MHVLAVFDLLGCVVLIITLLVLGVMQVGAALGIMYGMHTLTPEKLTETKYDDFDFDNFQQPAFLNLLVRLAIVFVGVTFVLHMADYFIVGSLIRRYRLLVSLVLFVLETGALAGGLHLMFKLDRFRWTVLTAGSALFYLFCLWYLAHGKSFLA
jgi:hypothetical protein